MCLVTTPDLPTLRDFLIDSTRPAGTFRYHELQGFLFAVASSPELIQPSDWLPAIFNDQPALYANLEEAQRILDQFMTLYNEVNAAVLEATLSLPADCFISTDVMANFDTDAPLAAWSRGFLQGHDWLEELWDVELPKETENELDAVLMILTFFSSRKVAEECQREGDFGDEPLEVVATRLLGLVPDAMEGYAHMGRTVLAEAYAPVEQRRVTKVGRNDPCPCGSGKKFKQCHGGT